MKIGYKIKILTAAFLTALTLSACSGSGNVPELLEPAVVEADIAVAEVRELADIYCYEGIVKPNVEKVGFASSGLISEVFAGIGSSVKKGDVLARLDIEAIAGMAEALSADIDYAVKSNELINRQSECDIKIAETELEKLAAEGAEPDIIKLKEIEIESLKNTYSSAVALQQLSLEQSRKQLDEYERIMENSVVKAPCDGTVLYCTASAGGWVSAYSTVFWIADDSTMNIECRYIKPHEIDDAYELYGIVGGIRTEVTHIPIDRAAYMSLLASGSAAMSQFSIDSPDIGAENGMYAYIILVKEYLPEALAVPANAVMQEGAEHYVYLVSPDGSQVRRTVRPGLKTDAFIQILEGLEEGDRVYVGN